MTNPNDSAFPWVAEDSINIAHGGLTKREHFAAMAMQAYIYSGAARALEQNTIAAISVKQAELLIEALNQKPE